MAKLRKGQNMVCVPCGRQVTVSTAGFSRSTLWCCGKPMESGKKAVKKTDAKKKPAKRKTAKKKK